MAGGYIELQALAPNAEAFCGKRRETHPMPRQSQAESGKRRPSGRAQLMNAKYAKDQGPA
jgi:hypothetical protein